MKKILLAFAHPDDESYFAAGTIAKYVNLGWGVDLVTATRGEAGSSGPFSGINGEKLGLLRQKELQNAGTILGISTITLLGYKDGALSDENPGEIEDKMCNKMIELVPDLVITLDTTGITNHPDHIKMCFATTFAFQKYAKWISDQLTNHPEFNEEHEPKLYYACLPQSSVEYLVEKKLIPSESFGKKRVGVSDKLVTTVIDISNFQTEKKKAMLAHISQEEDIKRYLSLASNPILKNEYFIQRYHGRHETFMGKTDKVEGEL